MSIPSDLSNPHRRLPRQNRGERRVAAILAAAAALIAEVGYEAATLTEVAARAGASIGTLYQYFPNKEAVAQALRVQYGDEMAARWTPLVAGAARLGVEGLVERVFAVMLGFLAEHPAYLPLLDAPVAYRRDPAAGNRLRGHFAVLFQEKRPGLPAKEAFRVASVTFQLIKSMNGLLAQASAGERRELVGEYKLALTAYLQARLRG